jgi:hypothetical protein
VVDLQQQVAGADADRVLGLQDPQDGTYAIDADI